MAERKVSVRLVAEGGDQIRAQFEGLGAAGSLAFQKIDAAQRTAADSAAFFVEAMAADEAFQRLRASVDPAVAALMRFEAQTEVARRAVNAGTTTQEEANRVLMLARENYDRATGAAHRFDAAQNAAAVGGRRSGVALQNASFQVADFAVQIAGGTSAARAFAQQAPQLLGGFGMFGAVAGAAVAILAAVAPALLRAGDAAETAGDQVENFVGALQNFRERSSLAQQSVSDLRKEFQGFALEVASTSQFLAQVALSDAMSQLGGASVAISSNIGEMREALAGATEAQAELETALDQQSQGLASSEQVQTFRENLEALQDQAFDAAAGLNLTVDQASALGAALDAVGSADGMVAVRDASQSALELLRDLYGTTTDIPGPIGEIATMLGDVRDEAARGAIAMAEVERATAGADFAVVSLSGHLAGASGPLGTLVGQAGSLWTNLAGAAGAALHLAMNRAAEITAENNSIQAYRQYQFLRDRTPEFPTTPEFNGPTPPVRPMDLGLPNPESGGGSAGGSGGGQSDEAREAERHAEAIKKVVDGLRDEIALIGLSDDARRLHQELQRADVELYSEEGQQIADLVEQITSMEAHEEAVENFRKSIESISDEIAKAILNGEKLSDVFGDMLRKMAQDLLSSGLETLMNRAFGPLAGGQGGGIWAGVGALLGFGGGAPLANPGIASALAGAPSGDGGGYTGIMGRSGGTDGLGGRPWILHDDEHIVPGREMRSRSGSPDVTISVTVNGARGNAEIAEMVQVGVGAGLRQYDESLAQRQKRGG